MKVIEATKEHLNDAYRLITVLLGRELNKEDFEKMYMKNLENNDIYYFLAVDDEEIVGFISLHIQKLLHHAKEVAEIQELVTDESKRGKGIGRALIAKAKEYAAKRDCDMLEVSCSMWRTKSHEFYINNSMQKSHLKFTFQL